MKLYPDSPPLPRQEIADRAGIKAGRGILVNESLQSNDAAGAYPLKWV